MSNPTIVTSFANPDPAGPNWTSKQDAVTELNLLISSTVQGTYVPYVVGSATPAVSDQDKVWAKTDSAGRPTALMFFYNGNWRRFYSGSADEVRIFIGNPSTHFDTDGLGKIGGEWDGWRIANGNSTLDMSNQFLVGANMTGNVPNGFTSTWQSTVAGTAASTGGAASYTLVNNNLPNMKVQLTGTSGYNDNGSGAPVRAVVTTKGYGGLQTTDVATFGADPSATPAVPQVDVPTVPPFKAVCFCIWVGYA